MGFHVTSASRRATALLALLVALAIPATSQTLGRVKPRQESTTSSKVENVRVKGPALIVAPPPLIISEFRLRGPGPSGATLAQQDADEFIEIYNNSNSSVTITTFDNSAGYAIAASDGVIRCTIPNNTVIPGRGHYLCVNSVGYSLSNYPAGNGTTATGDATYTADIPDNAGIAIFDTANTANFSLGTRLDAVGSTSEPNTLYKEGAGLPPLGVFNIDYSWYRDLSGGTPKETNNNVADFVYVDTFATNAGAGQRLGAPGPENLSSPIQRNDAISTTLIDPGCTGTATAATQPCPRFRSTVAVANGAQGTLSIRRRFVNNTASNVTRLRFRIVDITSFPAAPGNADLRALTSSDQPATCIGSGLGCPSPGAAIIIKGTTLEQPPNQPAGGALNSSLSDNTITLMTPLAPGNATIVQFVLGINGSGNYRFFINVEALP